MKVRRLSLFILWAHLCCKVDVFLKQYIDSRNQNKQVNVFNPAHVLNLVQKNI